MNISTYVYLCSLYTYNVFTFAHSFILKLFIARWLKLPQNLQSCFKMVVIHGGI